MLVVNARTERHVLDPRDSVMFWRNLLAIMEDSNRCSEPEGMPAPTRKPGRLTSRSECPTTRACAASVQLQDGERPCTRMLRATPSDHQPRWRLRP